MANVNAKMVIYVLKPSRATEADTGILSDMPFSSHFASLNYTKFAFCIIGTEKSFPQNIVFPSVTPPLPTIPHQKRSSQNQSPRFQLLNLIACRKQYPCLPASHRVSRRRRRERGLKKKDTHFAKCACMSAATRRYVRGDPPPRRFSTARPRGLKISPSRRRRFLYV